MVSHYVVFCSRFLCYTWKMERAGLGTGTVLVQAPPSLCGPPLPHTGIDFEIGSQY